MQENVKYTKELKQKLNEDLKNYFPHLFLVDDDMEKSFTSVSRLILLDRYAQKDINHISYSKGDLVLCVVKDDPKFPSRGIGYIDRITKNHVYIKLEEEYVAMAEDANNKGIIKRKIGEVDKPLELYYEQVCQRVANNLSCLLYTSDAADDLLCVDLGGRRIIKKKKNKLYMWLQI